MVVTIMLLTNEEVALSVCGISLGEFYKVNGNLICIDDNSEIFTLDNGTMIHIIDAKVDHFSKIFYVFANIIKIVNKGTHLELNESSSISFEMNKAIAINLRNCISEYENIVCCVDTSIQRKAMYLKHYEKIKHRKSKISFSKFKSELFISTMLSALVFYCLYCIMSSCFIPIIISLINEFVLIGIVNIRLTNRLNHPLSSKDYKQYKNTIKMLERETSDLFNSIQGV